MPDELKGSFSFRRFFEEGDRVRGAFVSRLFGLFSEEIVRIWTRCEGAAYEDLGRPTVRLATEQRGKTLDFTLRRKGASELYVGEMKCELEYENYKFLSLYDASQLVHHKQEGFQRFLAMARSPSGYVTSVNGRPVEPTGAILVWGAVTPEGRDAVMDVYGLADVLSLEHIINDLIEWESREYIAFVTLRGRWCEELLHAITPSQALPAGRIH